MAELLQFLEECFGRQLEELLADYWNAEGPLTVAAERFGVSDEWHLVFPKAFQHITFGLARLGVDRVELDHGRRG